MAKYHVNPLTGDARPCKAAYSPCPYGSRVTHFDSKAAAEEFYAEARNDSTKFLYEKEPGRVKPIRDGYLQGKMHPTDFRVGDIIRDKVTYGNTTNWSFREITAVSHSEHGVTVTQQVISEYDWKPTDFQKERQPNGYTSSFPNNNDKATGLRFILREKPAGWKA